MRAEFIVIMEPEVHAEELATVMENVTASGGSILMHYPWRVLFCRGEMSLLQEIASQPGVKVASSTAVHNPESLHLDEASLFSVKEWWNRRLARSQTAVIGQDSPPSMAAKSNTTKASSIFQLGKKADRRTDEEKTPHGEPQVFPQQPIHVSPTSFTTHQSLSQYMYPKDYLRMDTFVTMSS